MIFTEDLPFLKKYDRVIFNCSVLLRTYFHFKDKQSLLQKPVYLLTI